ncbi:D-alanyl-D-alanine carboxypeptidase family protein [Anaerosporobacter faecicola]|uniref:D-alanyl-D-alanine carboxypeptidase family protein n=1 Tax=Anaerosporobacter faecicola TaxID=2718714 RepID=UPI001EE4EDD6|nr:D-alanyl-D-alanine carboxypeptidase [Anaerosporobacter faecicola]
MERSVTMRLSRKIRVVGSLLVMLSLTGCSSSTEALMKYKDSNTSTVALSVRNDEIDDYGNLFSENLCVIPLKSDTDNDGNLTAEATLLVNNTDKKVLYASDIYEKLYPASITKVLTALVTIKNADLSDTVTVSYEASHITEVGASLCGLNEGDKIVLADLLNIFLISSGNDAGIAIAEHVAGSVDKFADMMNEQAKDLGATHSNFVNPHGLHDENHYTTAYDIYLIFREALKLETFVDIISTKSYEVSYQNSNGDTIKKNYTTTNLYLKGNEAMPDGITVIGGKTGTTNKAGSCLVLYSKDKSEKEYISVILKSDSKYSLYSQMSYLLKFIYK